MKANDCKHSLTDYANKHGLLRVIQSIPYRNVEYIKNWLAELGGKELDEETNKKIIVRQKLQKIQEWLLEHAKDIVLGTEARCLIYLRNIDGIVGKTEERDLSP